ncbi:Kinesin-like protein KIF15 [Holothuria leucospilota]|uniref:Kinesin-like protein KIF15 n=1 Tax=Holothuria leucospilota TaxID=206669 RepID=A0A9Q1CBM5_HOLLE|nr:Kinesin-like protein KIF15 [Holothuria leucospilota]
MAPSEGNDSNMEASCDGDSIKVFLRVRPAEESDELLKYSQCLDVQRPDTVILRYKSEKKVFTFDHVAGPEITQEAVFTAVGKRTIESCVAGYNGTIFAYGQTGSGKTFTMLGPSEKGDNFHHELRGVIPRSFEYIFSLVNREREKQGDRFEFLCRCSFLEIYNEQIFDLLDPASNGLNLRENIKKGVYVDGLIEQTVHSPHEAYNVLSAGWLNRRVAATSMNRESSRSHAVFTVSIETKEKKAGVANVRVSQLHLVDLAGSERQKDTKTDGLRLKEAGSINKSLSTLGNVIMALVDIAHGKQRFVPYRNSKLSFLLRDALGGNSKTFIIANVHPGAKCFGETLSTLNFARRAKMIKNKAVVNEDTQGNVSHLQAEIRRLKQQLIEYQTGVIPPSLSPQDASADESVPAASNQVSGSSSMEVRKWKKNFYHAMKLREEDIKELSEKASQLDALCQKKDKFLQSSKMIIRFRENTIAQLQKNQSSESKPDNKVKSLEKEIANLKEQLEHNPMVLKYAIENKKLRDEINRLKSLPSVRAGLELAAEHCAELEKTFQTLRENVDDSGNVRFGGTPTRTPTPTTLPSVDRQKLQELQTQLDSALQEAAEQKEVFNKKQIEMEAELKSSKKTIQELETALEGMKAKNRLDRDALNDMHLQTLKKITTPKKAAYQLRSRLVLRPSNTPGSTPSVGLSGDSTPTAPPKSESPLGIIDEDIPEHVMEQCAEALTVEVQKLQEKCTILQTQLDESESNLLKLTQNVSKLEYQIKQENELHAKEKTEWSEIKHDLSQQVEMLNSDLTELRENYEMKRSEAEDFRLMLQSVDKQHNEEIKQCEQRDNKHEKMVALLQTKLVKSESLASDLQKALDEGCQERELLEERNNTLEAEMSFMEQQRMELEERLKAEIESKGLLEIETKSLLERLEMEAEKNISLTQELQQGSDSTQRLAEINEQITKEAAHLRTVLQEKDAEIIQLNNKVQESVSMCASLQQKNEEVKEAMAQMYSNLQEAKAATARKCREMEDVEQQLHIIEQEKEEVAIALEGVQMNLEEMEAQAQMAANRYQQQIEKLREELQEMNSQHSDLLTEMEKQEFALQSTQADCEDLNDCIVSLEQKIKEKEEMIINYQQQLEEAQANLSTVMVESPLGPDVQALNQELESLRHSKETLTEQFEKRRVEFETMREEKNEEIASLKEKLQETNNLKKEKEQLEESKEQLKKSVQEIETEGKKREDELKGAIQSLEGKLSVMMEATSEANKVKEEKETLQNELLKLQANIDIYEDETSQLRDELERIRALEKAQFEEKEELRSKLEEVMEEKSKQAKTMKKLEEKNDELTMENAKLVGHQNFKQKIQYHLKLKQENNELREQLKKAHQETFNYKQELDNTRKKVGLSPLKWGKEQHPMPLKENINPETV